MHIVVYIILFIYPHSCCAHQPHCRWRISMVLGIITMNCQYWSQPGMVFPFLTIHIPIHSVYIYIYYILYIYPHISPLVLLIFPLFIWRFPEMGVPPVIIQRAWGTPIDGNPQWSPGSDEHIGQVYEASSDTNSPVRWEVAVEVALWEKTRQRFSQFSWLWWLADIFLAFFQDFRWISMILDDFSWFLVILVGFFLDLSRVSCSSWVI